MTAFETLLHCVCNDPNHHDAQALREAIAQEIEAKITKPKNIWDDDGHHRLHNFREAARIVRGAP